jgi:hypothetical protein
MLMMGGGRRKPDLAALLAPGVEACKRDNAPPQGWLVELEVETTYDEIVDVALTAGGGKAAALEACVIEAAWAVRLTASTFDLQREDFRLYLN